LATPLPPPEHGGMTSPLPALITSLLLGVAGLVSGAGARRLLGRMRRGARVPPPWCEFGVALAWAATGAAAAAGAVPVRWLPVLLALGWLAAAAGTVDVLHHRLPDALTLPALPLALLLLLPLGSAAVLRGATGALVAAGAYGVVHLAAPAAMGAGDVKLAAPLGAVLTAASWTAPALAAVLAAAISAVVAVVLVVCSARLTSLRSTRVRSTPLPHGPSMLVAAWIVALAAAGSSVRGP
jgi:leader peptidase (prepilin peptidase)/N-methyltransferase